MRRHELEILYGLSGEEVWPRGLPMQMYRHFCETISFDSRFYSWEYVISGGDPVTRAFALRAMTRIAKGRILVVAPVGESEAPTPWIFAPETHEMLSDRFGLGRGALSNVLRDHVQKSLSILDVRARVEYTRLAPFFYLGNDARLCVLRSRGPMGRYDPYQTLHKDFEGWFKGVPEVKPRAALIGGRLEHLWYLSGSGDKSWRNLEDFSFPISKNTPMLEAQSVWVERLEQLWRLSKRERIEK